MTTATDNSVPLSEAQARAVHRGIQQHLTLGGYDGEEDSASMEATGHELLRCAKVKRLSERRAFPVDDDALALVGEFEKAALEAVEQDKKGLAEDLLISQEWLALLRSIRQAVEAGVMLDG